LALILLMLVQIKSVALFQGQQLCGDFFRQSKLHSARSANAHALKA